MLKIVTSLVFVTLKSQCPRKEVSAFVALTYQMNVKMSKPTMFQWKTFLHTVSFLFHHECIGCLRNLM